MVVGVPVTRRDGGMESQCHDEDQPVEPVGIANLSVLDAEAA